MKSSNLQNIAVSQQKGIWSTTPSNEGKLNGAFWESSLVYLIFSVQGSGCFQVSPNLKLSISSGWWFRRVQQMTVCSVDSFAYDSWPSEKQSSVQMSVLKKEHLILLWNMLFWLAQFVPRRRRRNCLQTSWVRIMLIPYINPLKQQKAPQESWQSQGLLLFACQSVYCKSARSYRQVIAF